MQPSPPPSKRTLPPILHLFPNLCPPNKTLIFHQTSVLILTFLAYASFHASRKPPTIVKSVLSDSAPTGWPPFDGPEGTRRLGELDLAFLVSYSTGMFFAGHFGDRIDLRVFLVSGMMGSGLFTLAFGFGYWFNMHLLGYFVFVQVVCGLIQSIGWPSVVAVVGNWFGKEKRGLIMGVWNSHTSVGNIVGSVAASSVLEYGWGWSFVMPGILIVVIGFLVLSCLVVSPEDLGFEISGKDVAMDVLGEVDDPEKLDSEEAGLLQPKNMMDLNSSDAISFLDAWRLPGVARFAFCLFFSKLVAYTFLYWLPFYIRHTAVDGIHLSHKAAGILSAIFDIGGVLGGIVAGFVSDKTEARAATSVAFLILSIPALVLYRMYGGISMLANISLMFISGMLVNGPYSLITTAVATDLGTQSEIKGNSRALATVTAIIDGTGSVGAAIGPLLAGYISSRGWNSVFVMLIMSIIFATLFLIRMAGAEITKYKERICG